MQEGITTTQLPGGSEPAGSDIRIERLNTDKTRKDAGTNAAYQVFFELSGSPAPEWKRLFSIEWKESGLMHKADIDGPFLILQCQLPDVTPARLAALQKTVTAVNERYRQFAQGEASAATHRQEERQQERKNVEDVASSLHIR